MNVTQSAGTVAGLCGCRSPQEAQEQLLAHLDLVARLARYTCRRHHGGPEEMEEFESFTKLKLIEDDYAILRKFEGRSRLATYLSTVLRRLYLDHRNQVAGKWRPSAEARRLGRVAATMERLIVRDRHTVDEACEIVRTTMAVDAPVEELRLLSSRISRAPRRRRVGETAIAALWSDGGRADRDLLEKERADRAGAVQRQLERAVAALPDEDRSLVELRTREGLRIAEIARILDVPAKPLYRRLELIYRQLRKCLELEGVDSKMVGEVLSPPVAESSSLVAGWRM